MLDELTTTSYFAVSTDSMLDVMLFMCIPGMLDELTTTSYFAVSTDLYVRGNVVIYVYYRLDVGCSWDELTTSYFAVSTDSMLDVMLFMCIPGMLDELTTTNYFAVSTDSMLDVVIYVYSR